MAFISVQSSGGGDMGERLPLLKYDARAGRLFTVDRVQDAGGEWSSVDTDVTMQQPAFAVDFGTLDVGWAFFAPKTAPMWALAPFGQPMPARPASPGADDKGKALTFKQAFRVKVIGKGIGGVRELGGNSAALIGGLNELHTEYESAPEAAAGMIPLVKLTNSIPLKTGQSTNYQPVFVIQQWVARPDTLGVRTVPPPSGSARTSTPVAPAPQQSNHVPPPTPKQAAPAAAELEDAMPF